MPSRLSPSPCFRPLRKWLAFALGAAVIVGPLHAIILYDGGSNTAAPSGAYADSGWESLGEFGGSLGTIIAPQYFITAQHVGLASTFVSAAEFNGLTDVTYTIDTAANGGTGYWDIGGSDLRIFKVNETFSSYAPLYTAGSEVGLEMVTFGRGGPRGAEVLVGSEVKGWYHTGSDGVTRWGTNEISGVVSSGVGSLLTATFDAGVNGNEATFSAGDSGGAMFVYNGSQWQLAGINYGVDGLFDFDANIDDNEFGAALYDMGGLYLGNDAQGWTLTQDLAEDVASTLYVSRISEHAAAIQSIVGVPEPGTGVLLVLALTLSMRRGRKRPN